MYCCSFKRKTESERFCKAREASRSAVLGNLTIENRRNSFSVPASPKLVPEWKPEYDNRTIKAKTMNKETASVAMTKLNESVSRMLRNKQIEEVCLSSVS